MRKYISYLLAVCMLAGLFVLPAGTAGALGTEVVLYDVHYDEATGQMVLPSENAPSGTLNAEKQGLEITGKTTFNYYVSTAADMCKVMTLKLRITPENQEGNRFFQAHPKTTDNEEGYNYNIIAFRDNGQVEFIDDDRNKEMGNTFAYTAGHTYFCTVEMDMSTHTATATAVDETENQTVFQKEGLLVPETTSYLNRIKNEITSDASSVILHLMQLTRKEPALGEDVEVLVDAYYDPATETMMPEDAAVLDYSEFADAVVNTDLGGLQVSVKGKNNDGDGLTKTLYFMWPDSMDTTGKLVNLHMVTTMSPLNSRRWLQLYRSDGTTVDAFATNPNKEFLFFDNNLGKYALDGKKLDIQIQLNFGAGTATLTIINLDANETVIASETVDISIDHVKKIGLKLQPKDSDGEMKTILHSFSATMELKNEISIQPYAIGMPPYTAGDTVMLRLQQSGEAPVQVTAYCDGTNLGTKTDAPYEWTTPALEAGTHTLHAVAEYADSDPVVTQTQITARPYTTGTVHMDSDMESSSAISPGGTNGNVSYTSMPGVEGRGNALLLQPNGEDANFNVGLTDYFADADLVTWESDVMFTDIPGEDEENTSNGQRGLEVRFHNTDDEQKDVIVLKAAQDGNLTFAGSSLSVPYEADMLYHVKLQLNKNGKYNIVVSDTDGAVFSGYNLTWYNSPVASMNRFKFQQNQNTESTATGMYLDNVKIYDQTESDSYIDTLTAEKDGALLYDLSQVKQGDTMTLRANIRNNGTDTLDAPVMLFAVMDDQDRVIGVATAESQGIEPGQDGAAVSATVTATQDLPEGAYVKAFAWSDLSGLQPVTAARTY